MSQLASPIVGAVVKYVTSLVARRYQLVRGVDKEFEKLSDKLTSIQLVLEDAEIQQRDNSLVRRWVEKLQEAAYDAQDALATFEVEAGIWQKKQQVRSIHPPISTSKIAYKLWGAEEFERLLARLDEILKEKEQLGLKVIGANYVETTEGPHTGFLVGEVVGREDDKNKIAHFLLSEEFDREGDICVVPIVGMGGLGKTTLAQQLYNDDRIKSHFEFRMWVCVTVNFNYKRILKEMVEYHTEMKYDINSMSDAQLQTRLLDFLARKQFLLVLDDVWTQNIHDWEKLQTLLKEGGKGSRVLITGRDTRVSDVMGTVRPYHLEYLPEDHCWSLFAKIAFKQQEDVAGLESIGREIVGKCKGLPLAVKAMAGLLRGNTDVEKWKNIAKHEIWEVEKQPNNTGNLKVLPVLRFSYDNLPSHLKQCFAFCYIFPKAYVFDKSELVKLWKAESFILSEEEDSTYEIGGEYFDQLVTRSFFQLLKIENKQRYSMHDLMHDVAQSVSSPHCFQVKKEDESRHLCEASRHVSLLCEDVEKPALEVIDKAKRLRTLLLPSEYLKSIGQSLDKLFRSLKYMRALDLSSTTLTELPNSVGELKLLLYLDLSKTEIRALPNSICSLYNLQTLKLLGCLWLFQLPDDLGDLVKLEHLELDDMFWFKASKLPPRMGSLTRLQNLHAFQISHESGYRIDELKHMKCLKGRLHISKLEDAVNAAEAKLKDKEGLKELVLEWSSSDEGRQDEAAEERVLDDLQPHSNLQRLQILCYRGIAFPSWVRDGVSLQNLTSLSLKHCSKCKDNSFGQLMNLQELHIKGMLELEEWTDDSHRSLVKVEISNCPKLREVPQLFPEMLVMKIKRCDLLKSLPLTPLLRSLILVDNPVLEDWNENGVFYSYRGQITGPVSSFLDLRKLKIVNCPKFQALPEHMCPEKLEISGCQLLSTLPSAEHSQFLQHLALDAYHGGTLVKAIPGTGSLYSLVISNISGLTHLPKLPHLPALKTLYILHCKDLVSLAEEEEKEAAFQGLPDLKLLSIRGCPMLLTLPEEQPLPASIECLSIGSCPGLKSLGPKEMLKNLTSLRDLYLEDCPSLQSFPEEGLPASLQHLRIENCPSLSNQCRKDSGPDWPKIMHIPDLEDEFDRAEVPSTQNSPVVVEEHHPQTEETSSTPWYQSMICCGGQTSKGKTKH